MWIQRFLSSPPASISATRVAGSSLSRAATAHPADPAPITMKSASIVRCSVAMSCPPLAGEANHVGASASRPRASRIALDQRLDASERGPDVVENFEQVRLAATHKHDRFRGALGDLIKRRDHRQLPGGCRLEVDDEIGSRLLHANKADLLYRIVDRIAPRRLPAEPPSQSPPAHPQRIPVFVENYLRSDKRPFCLDHICRAPTKTRKYADVGSRECGQRSAAPALLTSGTTPAPA